jgi:hypothetical protein
MGTNVSYTLSYLHPYGCPCTGPHRVMFDKTGTSASSEHSLHFDVDQQFVSFHFTFRFSKRILPIGPR